MYSTVLSIHSYFAWLALVLVVAGIAAAIFSKDHYRKLAKFAMIGTHIQLLIGLILYFVSPFGFSNLSGESMKDSFTRLLSVEHPFTNIIAIVLITIGHMQSKKLEDGSRKIIIFYSIGLLLLLSRIPWSTWLG